MQTPIRSPLIVVPQQHRDLLAVIALLILIIGNWIWHPLAAGPTEQNTPLAHWIGIVGSVLVIVSQLYSIKKRTRAIKLGTGKDWLNAHILLGLSGAVLVELHCGPVWYGVAGLSRLAMWLVVLSGFMGRYLYSLIPVTIGEEARAAEALTSEKHLLDQDIAKISQNRLEAMQHAQNASLLAKLGKQVPVRSKDSAFASWAVFRENLKFFMQTLSELSQAQREIQHQYRAEQTAIHDLYARLFERIGLERRAAWLMVSDQAVRIWRLFHIPPCLFLLVVTALHVWTVLYY